MNPLDVVIPWARIGIRLSLLGIENQVYCRIEFKSIVDMYAPVLNMLSSALRRAIHSSCLYLSLTRIVICRHVKFANQVYSTSHQSRSLTQDATIDYGSSCLGNESAFGMQSLQGSYTALADVIIAKFTFKAAVPGFFPVFSLVCMSQCTVVENMPSGTWPLYLSHDHQMSTDARRHTCTYLLGNYRWHRQVLACKFSTPLDDKYASVSIAKSTATLCCLFGVHVCKQYEYLFLWVGEYICRYSLLQSKDDAGQHQGKYVAKKLEKKGIVLYVFCSGKWHTQLLSSTPVLGYLRNLMSSIMSNFSRAVVQGKEWREDIEFTPMRETHSLANPSSLIMRCFSNSSVDLLNFTF